MKTVAIQGIAGAFHEEAALKYFGSGIKTSSSHSFSELLGKVSSAQSDFGIIAIENTVAGTIHQNLQLIRNHELHISGEINLHIQQNLAALPGTRIEDMKEVRSHYMAINQSKQFLDQYPSIVRINDTDTASSLKSVSTEQLKNVGAIGSAHGANLYGLEIIAPSIETHKENFTRFLVLERNPVESTSGNKASWILKLRHEKGALAKLLTSLDEHNINLSKIESFPILGEPWNYEFFLDLEYIANELHLKATQIIDEQSISNRLLGRYDAFEPQVK